MPSSRRAFTGGDLLLGKISSNFNFASGQLTAPGSGGVWNFYLDQVAGYPLLASNVLAIATDEASVVALLVFGNRLDDLADSASTTEVPQYTILNDFTGVVINKDVIATKDASLAATAFTLATIVTALEALGAKVVTGPTKSTTQTN